MRSGSVVHPDFELHRQKSAGGHASGIDNDGQRAPLGVQVREDIIDHEHLNGCAKKGKQDGWPDFVLGDIAPIKRHQKILEDSGEKIEK